MEDRSGNWVVEHRALTLLGPALVAALMGAAYLARGDGGVSWPVVGWCVLAVFYASMVVVTLAERRAGLPAPLIELLRPLAVPFVLLVGSLGAGWCVFAVLIVLAIAMTRAIRSGYFATARD